MPLGARKLAGSAAVPNAARSNQQQVAWLVVSAAAIVPVVALMALRGWSVPLGQPGKFTYLYSELTAQRQRSVPLALVLGAAAATGVWLLGGRGRMAGLCGGALAMTAVLGLGAWAYFSPPGHILQHVFNFQSPSQDGAFANEAREVREVRAYLIGFPQRARTPPAEMRGTRVISNPPGATLLAVWAGWLLERSPALRSVAVGSFGDEELNPEFERKATQALVFAWLLLALWLAAAPVLYLAARECLPRGAAATIAVCATVSAPTLLFSPGKDPAQLLTVALLLWFWLRAVRLQSPVWAFLAGVALVPGCFFSLVHVWVAAILVAATLGSAVRERAVRRRLVRNVLPAAAAFVLVVITLNIAFYIDLFAIARAAAASQAEVTRIAPDAMPLVWQLLGVPLFLLFCGPAVWCAGLGLLSKRGQRQEVSRAAPDASRMGAWLTVTTVLVVLGTVGFTNAETPRLWIPFVPLLLLGAGLLVSARVGAPAARSVLALLVFAQIASAAVQWTLMDMREAEMRLIQRTPTATPRLFD